MRCATNSLGDAAAFEQNKLNNMKRLKRRAIHEVKSDPDPGMRDALAYDDDEGVV